MQTPILSVWTARGSTFLTSSQVVPKLLVTHQTFQSKAHSPLVRAPEIRCFLFNPIFRLVFLRFDRSRLTLGFRGLLRNLKDTDFQRLAWYCTRDTTQDCIWTYLVSLNQSASKDWACAPQIQLPSTKKIFAIASKGLFQPPNIFSDPQM